MRDDVSMVVGVLLFEVFDVVVDCLGSGATVDSSSMALVILLTSVGRKARALSAADVVLFLTTRVD